MMTLELNLELREWNKSIAIWGDNAIDMGWVELVEFNVPLDT